MLDFLAGCRRCRATFLTEKFWLVSDVDALEVFYPGFLLKRHVCEQGAFKEEEVSMSNNKEGSRRMHTRFTLGSLARERTNSRCTFAEVTTIGFAR